MYKVLFLVSFSLLTISCFGQETIQTKEMSLFYLNGRQIFQICLEGCKPTFEGTKDYCVYVDDSSITLTQDYSFGSLLHGNSRFYDLKGHLREDRNYFLGLKEGAEKIWDSLGTMISFADYTKGVLNHSRFLNLSGQWVEFTGPVNQEGTVKRVYTKDNRLISEEINLSQSATYIKRYYEDTGTLEEEYTVSDTARKCARGRYTHYYKNGSLSSLGQYADGKNTDIKIGTWKSYSEDGSVARTDYYKAHIEHWPNGMYKVTGGYILDKKTNAWLQDQQWSWYDESGKLLESKRYGRETE